MKTKKPYNFAMKLVDRLQSEGRYSFTLREARQEYPGGRNGLKMALNRFAKKNKIISVYKGFYAIVPPEYSIRGILPAPLFIDDLMRSLQKPYYVGLLSAAALHGAGHQQPQEYHVMTVGPSMRPVKKRGLSISFFIRSAMPRAGLEEKKTDTGHITISGPELTAVDLVRFADRIGGLARVTGLLAELAGSMRPEKMAAIAGRYAPITCWQRLGYILETVLKADDLADAVFKRIGAGTLYRITLDLRKKGSLQNGKNRWHVAVNTRLEPEA